MKKWIANLLFKLYGWKLVGTVPKEIRKYVLIAAPHTSNMDFFLAMPTMWSLGVPGKYLIKKEHVDAPHGFLIKWFGGIGVDRQNQSKDFVIELNEIVDRHKELVMLFTPEGTRKRVKKWKTGFYRVATAVNVPIVLAYANYVTKEVHIGHVFHPSGDFEKDFSYMEEFYKNVPAKFPEDYNPVIFDRK
jgi:1-acyl-sn-glycerol-3-phosphate acyltransferase